MKILCVGELVADIVANPVTNIDFTIDNIGVEEISLKNGGDALNTSVNLAKLGSDVSFIGKVGKDIFGDFLIDKAESVGVNMDHIRRSDHLPTSKVIGLIKENGDRCFIQSAGANSEFSIHDIDLSLLDECSILHIGGTFHLQNFDGVKGCVELLRLAREKGIITTMDVCWDHSGKWAEVIYPCFQYLNYIIPSIGEAKQITGKDNVEEMCEYFKFAGVESVIIKMGEKGTYCSTWDGDFYCGSYKVDVNDTTGAGDGFVAGFLFGIGNDLKVEECVKMGTAVSAFVIQHIGATDGSPTFSEIVSFIEKNQLEVRYE
ncbi:carbohydrate kinase family protein [Radiobacillus sp. PE A8.2]|uniref:carbohydrate kinase family protein n=1 Tax=Radiobacillus sp. PE A8.2 TaxID=3380349 RepID=UPI00388CEDF6